MRHEAAKAWILILGGGFGASPRLARVTLGLSGVALVMPRLADPEQPGQSVLEAGGRSGTAPPSLHTSAVHPAAQSDSWSLVEAVCNIMSNMKTIAITIDDGTLKLLDQLVEKSGRARSRSALVRTALREFAERARNREIEAHEGRILTEHRKRLAREAAALIQAQARP
jgi:Arc/MetJ-type ribon-helix-helix transcriptional regulator